MRKSILDTDILLEIAKGIDTAVLQNASGYIIDEHPRLSFTSISVYEVLHGLKVKSAAKQTQEFLDLISDHEELMPETEDYHIAADIRAAMHTSGTPIGSIDPIIAACAIRRGLPLVTGNTRHHNYIQTEGFALQLVNWREP